MLASVCAPASALLASGEPLLAGGVSLAGNSPHCEARCVIAARRARISCGDMPLSESDAVAPDDVDNKPDCVLPVEAEGVWTIAPAEGSTRKGGGNCVARGVNGATEVGARVAAGLESVRLATGDDPTDEDPVGEDRTGEDRTGEGVKEDGLEE